MLPPALPAFGGFDKDALQAFYEEVTGIGGVDVDHLRARLEGLFELDRDAEDVQAYREGRKPWKKLRDEVVPVATLLARTGRKGRVRFPLNDQPPDAWFLDEDGSAPVGIEVTGALARSRGELARELRDSPMAPGFRGLADPLPQKVFDAARSRGRITHSGQGVAREIEAAVRLCMEKKADPKYAGHILLIVAPLEALPRRHWSGLVDRLAACAAELPFAKVFLQGTGERAEPLLLADVAGGR